MAQLSRARLLQLLRGTGKHRQFESVPGSATWALVAHSVSPQPTTPALATHAQAGRPVASSTGRAPSLPRSPLRRYSSKIRTGCANKRPSGSARGAISNDRPYRDLKFRLLSVHFRRERFETGRKMSAISRFLLLPHSAEYRLCSSSQR